MSNFWSDLYGQAFFLMPVFVLVVLGLWELWDRFRTREKVFKIYVKRDETGQGPGRVEAPGLWKNKRKRRARLWQVLTK